MSSINYFTVALAIPAIGLLAHFIPWLLDPCGVKGHPGPFLAKFSHFWLGYVSKMGHRSDSVHKAHQKYGPIVRIAPNHISVADPEALNSIYGHGNGALKSDFYDAFVSIRRGVFNTRDRPEHTRKRKIISHIFSQKNVLEFEPHLKRHVLQLIKRWDQFHDLALKGMSGNDGEGGWEGRDGRLYLNVLPWVNYLAFDIIGDLSFGAPFGMLESGKDVAMAPKHHGSQQALMNSYGKQEINSDVIGIPAVEILNGRGDFSMCIGVLPPSWRPIVSKLPGYRFGTDCVRYLAGISIMAVAKRLANPTDRNDLLSKLQNGRDDEGKPLGAEELTAEAQTFLIAGSDSSANSITAIIYHIASNPRVQAKLQKELDDHLGAEDDVVAPADQVKLLPYLDACVNEALRVHTTSGIGLPRVAPKGGLTVSGQYFAEGTILSVPSYTIHRDVNVWGEDVEVFRPERWFERDQSLMQKTLNTFSVGPRACVGRNLAMMEMRIVAASLFRRYSFVLERPEEQVEIWEGFLRKLVSCRLGIRRRD
ncbi:cytochrome P450 monooxygenase [Amanita rubescens]|nr:cytochrome P450 monooxygenase [Amanita rubescens]